MSAQVFISHSSKDRKIAGTICLALESRGLNCWIAARDVPPGDNFMEAIVAAIRASRVMVLVFTGNANNSDEVKRELVLASQNHVVLIPVRVEDIVPSDAFTYQFATRQWIDLFGDWEHQIERLIVSIERIVAADASHASQASSHGLSSVPAVAAVHSTVERPLQRSETAEAREFPSGEIKPPQEQGEIQPKKEPVAARPPAPVKLAGVLLILEAVVRAGFAFSLLAVAPISKVPAAFVLLSFAIPLALALAAMIAGILIFRSHSAARSFGIAAAGTILGYHALILLLTLGGGYLMSGMAWPLFVFNTCVAGFALAVLVRWRRPETLVRA